jgi:hypothetical protein
VNPGKEIDFPKTKKWPRRAVMKNKTVNALAKAFSVVLGIALVQSASAQSFKKIKVKGGAALVQVSSGGSSVWGLASNGHPYIFNGKQFVLANNISLSQISVGGGNAAQADTVWARDSGGAIYSAAKSGTTWTFTQVPSRNLFTHVVAGPGYQDSCHPYEVWALNSGAQIFRYDFCGKNFALVNGILCSAWVGGGDMWGNDCLGNIFRYNFATGGFDQIPGALTEIAVGPNGVFGISSDTLIWEFHDNIQNFTQLPGSLGKIAAGGNGVWGLNSAQQVYRLEPGTATFVQVSGQMASISVGSGGGVWGIDNSGKVYAFTTP